MNDFACDQRKFSSLVQYSASKLFNVLFSVGIENFLAKKSLNNVKAVSVHPGVIETDIRNGVEEILKLDPVKIYPR